MSTLSAWPWVATTAIRGLFAGQATETMHIAVQTSDLPALPTRLAGDRIVGPPVATYHDASSAAAAALGQMEEEQPQQPHQQ